jgi:hypothetical protein
MMAQRNSGPAPRKQVASSNSAFVVPQQQRQQQHPRSNPIAIRRRKPSHVKGEDQSIGSSSTSDEEENKDESISDNYLYQFRDSHASNTRDSAMSHSLPNTTLLRAPKLGSSVPNEEEELPVLKLTDPQLEDDLEGIDGGTVVDKTEMSYGSLRESQLEGRFLQRPRSNYHRPGNKLCSSSQMENVPSTGKKNVRFQMASSAPTTFTGLSIGERIQQSRQQQKQQMQQEQEQKQPHSISSLSAMLENSTVEASPQDLPQTFHSNEVFRAGVSSTMEDSIFPDDHWILDARNRSTNNDDEAMLSTSLTGLEVLQRGLADRSLSSSFRSGTNASNNHALARSYSDPVSSQSRRAVPQVNFLLPPASSSSTTTQFTSAKRTTATASSSRLFMLARRDGVDERFVVTAGNSTGTVPPRYCSAFGMLTLQSPSTPSGFASSGLLGSSLLQASQPSQANSADQVYQNSTDIDFDPDNEGAFDMDME